MGRFVVQKWLEVFTAEGRPREMLGNRPLSLDDRDGVWIVRCGRVDVFAAPPAEAGRPVPRRHLFRAPETTVLFGVGRDGSPGGSGLLAVGVPGSEVLHLSRRRLAELAAQPDLGAELGALLDGWLWGLTAGVAGAWTPKRVALLEPRKEVWLPAGGVACTPRDGLWVCHLRGASQFLGKANPPLGVEAPPFPLAGPGWLTAREEDTRLTAVTTDAVLGEGKLWAGLDNFHQLVLACMAVNATEMEAAERERWARRGEAERRLIRTTLSRLAEVADPDGAAAATPTEEAPLLAACRLVGDSLGVPIQAPVGGVERKRRSDPVSAIARASRLRVRRVLLSGDWWRRDNGPLLAFKGHEERPVAVLPVSPSRYVLADPAAGVRTPLSGQGAAALLPFGYSFYRPFGMKPLNPWGLFQFGLAGSGRDWAFVLLLGLAGALLGMLTPLVTGWIFDRIIPGGDQYQLLVILLCLVVSAAATALFQIARGVAMLRLETKMEGSVQAGVWDRLLNLPAPFFRRYTAGDLASRAMGVAAIREVLTDVVLSSLLSFVFSLVYFILLFSYSTRLALLACVLYLGLLLVTSLSALVQLRYQRGIYQARGKISGLVLQLLTGISRLRVAGAEERALAVWGREFSAQRRLAFKARAAANGLAAFQAATPILNSMVLFGMVAFMPRDSLSLGAFLAFSVAFFQILSAAIMMGSTVTYAVQIIPLYERAKPILETPPEVDAAKAVPADLSGDVEVSHVSFRYHGDGPLVLEDVSLHVRPGEFVAFLGPSGAGKSTILRLLLGFESPSSGSIYYDREDLAALDRQAVRRQIGVVLQDGKLLTGDIFTNIVGSALLTLDDAWEAARLSGLDEDVKRMPMGMHTVISDGGSTLSGGQRQRLMIARAVVSRPRILLFDEATSALDNETQAKVTRSLERLKATRIVIAHRLSTVVNADRIYVLSAGRIVQQGRYPDLMKQGGLFVELMQRQMV